MKHGMNSTEMQRRNRALVVKALMDYGSLTRTQLADCLGLQKATITNIVNEFQEMDLIQVVGEKAAGRRGEFISLKTGSLYILSVGITRKDYRIGIFFLNGDLVEEIVHEYEKGEAFTESLSALKQAACAFAQNYSKEKCVGVCVSVPGPFYVKEDEGIEEFQVSEFEGFNTIHLRSELEEALDMPIVMVHDAKLAAYAEWKNLPNAVESREKILMVIRSRGFGIGAGIVVGGKILEGQLGIAGEIGHMGIHYNMHRSKEEEQGTYEYNAGTESAVRYMHELMFQYPDSELRDDSKYADIVKAYEDEDPLAVAVIDKMAGMLAFGISNFIYTINPDCIIVGRDYPKSDAFLDKVKEVVGRYVHPIVMEHLEIRFSDLNYDSFLIGGYYHMINAFFEHDEILEILCNNKAR